MGASEWTPFLSGIDINNIIQTSATVQLYNSTQADIFSLTNANLQSCSLVHITFLSAYAGDTLTNLTWDGATIDEVIKNETYGGIQHYIAKVTFDSNILSLKADYAYARNRACYVYVVIV